MLKLVYSNEIELEVIIWKIIQIKKITIIRKGFSPEAVSNILDRDNYYG